jgi:hypothetical protein
MKRIIRDRFLTPEEAERYQMIRRLEELGALNAELLDALRVIGYSFWTDGEPIEERFNFLQETARAAIRAAVAKAEAQE